MSTPVLPRALLAASAVISPALACASPQDHRPDAEGYPCSSAPQLAIVQDPQGFVIRRQPGSPAKIAPAQAESRLEIGTSLKFDLAIFKRMTQQREADDASCC